MRTNELAQRLADRSMPEPNSGCLLWCLWTSANGYGRMDWRGKTHAAHRLAWEARHGPIPDGLVVCHKCDVRSCVNVDHLFLGTMKDNVADMYRKGRQHARQGEANPGATKLKTADVLAIRRTIGPNVAIARRYGISVSHASAVRSGKKWPHLREAA